MKRSPNEAGLVQCFLKCGEYSQQLLKRINLFMHYRMPDATALAENLCYSSF